MNSSTNILGVHVSNLSMEEAVEQAYCFLSQDKLHTIFTPNSEIIMEAYRDKEFCSCLNQADLLTPDGIGVVYAAKLLKTPLKERVAGYDLTVALLEKMRHTEFTVYILGGKPNVPESAKERMESLFPGIRIVGTHDGYFQDDTPILNEINRLHPNLLLVCLGAPKQEKWIMKNKEKLNVNLAIGAGGSVDVFAGTVKRAPDFFIRHGLEWLYRLLKQPSRLIRMLDLPKFIITVFCKGKRFTEKEDSQC